MTKKISIATILMIGWFFCLGNNTLFAKEYTTVRDIELAGEDAIGKKTTLCIQSTGTIMSDSDGEAIVGMDRSRGEGSFDSWPSNGSIYIYFDKNQEKLLKIEPYLEGKKDCTMVTIKILKVGEVQVSEGKKYVGPFDGPKGKLISIGKVSKEPVKVTGDWDWFLAPEGTKKEFEVRALSGENPVFGKASKIISEVKTDQFGGKIVKIISEISTSRMRTHGYSVYKLDTKTNRILQIETYDAASNYRETWDDHHPYVIMSLPLTIGKVWGSYEGTHMSGRKILGKEKVKLPVGELEVIVIKDENSGDMEYYAKGIGLVAMKVKNYWLYKLTKISKQ